MMTRPMVYGGKNKRPKQFRTNDALDKAIAQFQKDKNISTESDALRTLIKLGITYYYTQQLDE